MFPNITPTKFKSGYIYEIIGDDDVQSEDELRRLLDRMYDDPEHEFFYYARARQGCNAEIGRALSDNILADGEVENFYYRRAPNARSFVRVEPHRLDSSHADLIFGFEKSEILWLQELASGEMYSRRVLTLTERTRRAIAEEHARDSKLVEIKLGWAGVKLDVRKSVRVLRDWWKERRFRRNR